MTQKRNILLLGRTGNGKSTLANVLLNKNGEFEEVFKESSESISKTEDLQIELLEMNSEVSYRIADTVGVGDNRMSPQEVLWKLARISHELRNGLNQVLFVTKGRFTKEEAEAYDLLSSIIFDSEVVKHTTIVRAGFPGFTNENKCETDRQKLKTENPEIAHIFKSVRKIIYVDNPPLDYGEMAIQTREKSRTRLITYLGTCQDTYHPSNLATLNERIGDYMTNEEKLIEQMKELEEKRKEEAEKFLKEIERIEKEQEEKRKKMEEENKKKINELEKQAKEELQKTKAEMEDRHNKDMNNLKQENKQQIKDLQDSHRQETQRIIDENKRQLDSIQEQNRRDRESSEKLINELRAKNTSSANEIASALEKLNLNKNDNNDDGKWSVRIKELETIENNAKRAHDERMAGIKTQQELARQQASRGMQQHIEQRGPNWGGVARDAAIDAALTAVAPPIGIIKTGIDIVKHIFS